MKRGKGRPRTRLVSGTRKQVWDDNHPAQITTGGLKKEELFMSYNNIIKSKKASFGRKAYMNNQSNINDSERDKVEWQLKHAYFVSGGYGSYDECFDALESIQNVNSCPAMIYREAKLFQIFEPAEEMERMFNAK